MRNRLIKLNNLLKQKIMTEIFVIKNVWKFRINSDDNLPLERRLLMHDVVSLVRSVLEHGK